MTAKLPEKDELSPRWAIFLDLRLKGYNAYQAAVQAGFSEEYAKVITSRYPEKVIKSLNEALEAKGISSDVIAERISALLYATKPVFVKGDTGPELVDEAPDYQAIDKGITHAIKVGIGGGYAAEKHVVATIRLEPSPQIRALADRLLVLQSKHEEGNEDDARAVSKNK